MSSVALRSFEHLFAAKRKHDSDDDCCNNLGKSSRPRSVDVSPVRVENPLQGVYVFPDFVTPAEELELLRFVDRTSGLDFDSCEHDPLLALAGTQWVVSAEGGLYYHQHIVCKDEDGVSNGVDTCTGMPAIFASILDRMHMSNNGMLRHFVPNDVRAISCESGYDDRLDPHVDTLAASGELIVNLTLCGSCHMTYDINPLVRPKVLLKRRSLQVFTGKAKYKWSHGISSEDLHDPRFVSITLRCMK